MKQENCDSLRLKNQLGFKLYAAARKVTCKYTTLLKKIDLTYTQYIVMLVLWEKETITVGELGKCLCLDTGTLSPLLKTMETRGIITRSRDKSDERVVMVSITDSGRELKKNAFYVPIEIEKQMTISHEEAVTLSEILCKIIGESAPYSCYDGENDKGKKVCGDDC